MTYAGVWARRVGAVKRRAARRQKRLLRSWADHKKRWSTLRQVRKISIYREIGRF